jgi:rubrerythrin
MIDELDADIEEQTGLPVQVEFKLELLAGSLWAELRERTATLDSERWSKLVLAKLREVTDEFQRRVDRSYEMHAGSLEEVKKLRIRIRRYQRKYGCVHCGTPIQGQTNTDQCSKCCHMGQKKELLEKRNQDVAC